MINKETLKKHNLKAVPFSCIGEGEMFWTDTLLSSQFIHELAIYGYRKEGRLINWADGFPMGLQEFTYEFKTRTVYVPVWRVTEVTS